MGDFFPFDLKFYAGLCVVFSVCLYPVSVDDSDAARVGANPLLFDAVEHVDEQRAVHLVGQVDGRVTLKTNHRQPREDTHHY